MTQVAWLGIAVCTAALAFGQATQSLTFEVASVKSSPPIDPNTRIYFGPPRGGPGTPDPGQITWTYATLRSLLMTAYDLKTYQLSGPAWLDTERYDIAVKVAAGTTKAQVNVMWQNLVAERSGVKLHHEPKEFQVEEMVVAKSGAKLKDTAEDLTKPQPPGPPQTKNGELLSPGFVTTIFPGSSAAKAHSVARAQDLSQVAAMLSNQLRRPVLDKTGLTGKYDFTLEYAIDVSGLGFPPTPAGAATDSAASEPEPDLAAAVQQQLGLKLVAGKAMLDVVVIDKAEKIPTEN